MHENGGGRDRNTGQFLEGHQFARSRGNPVTRRMHELRKALLDCVDEAELRDVVGKLSELARNGDVPAAKVWLEHVVGKPPQAIQVTGPDGGPLRLSLAGITGTIMAALASFPDAQLSAGLALQAMITSHGRCGDDGLADHGDAARHQPDGLEDRAGPDDAQPGFRP
jgi:hypothetical protein